MDPEFDELHECDGYFDWDELDEAHGNIMDAAMQDALLSMRNHRILDEKSQQNDSFPVGFMIFSMSVRM